MNKSTRWLLTSRACADRFSRSKARAFSSLNCSERRMNKLAALLSTLVLLAACGKQEPAPSAPAPTAPAAEQPATPAPATEGEAAASTDQAAAEAATAAPAETVSEMDDAPTPTEQQTATTTQPQLKLSGAAGGPP